MHSRFTASLVAILAVAFLGLASARADFSEDFTSSTVLGSGTAANYTPGTDWTVDHGSSKVEPSAGVYGANGTCRMGYSGSGSVGQANGTPYRILRNSSTGGGTYFSRSQRRLVLIVGRQDANNYYRIETNYMYRTGIGNATLAVGKVVNNVTTWLAGAVPGSMQEGGTSDNYELTVTWDASANTVAASLVIKNSGGTTLDSCSTSAATGAGWTTGVFGCTNNNSLIEVDKVSFTAPNAAPTVDAGSNQTITLPAQANLSGSASDDGLPNPPASMTYTWSKTSGPGSVTFGNANSLSTTATFSASGTYVLNLQASDSALSSNDTVTIVANAAPTVDAGNNQTITLPAQANLSGSASDDGLPNPPGAMTYTWSKSSGPGTVTFGNANALSTTATFSVSGTYVLNLQANDGNTNSNDTVTITVNSANTAPTVDAGSNQTITLPAQANLSGSASDDGLPNPPAAMTYTWSKTSGPGSVTFGNANALSTTATFSASGTYVLNLQANDSALSSNDTVTITVNAAAASIVMDFQNSSDLGSGTGASYTPGTDWTVDHGTAQVNTSTGVFGAAGTCRLGYTGTPHVGPENSTPYRILYKTDSVGSGTYFTRSKMRLVQIVGYQDANNYYRIETSYNNRSGLGNCTLAVGKVVNNVTTWLAGATPSSIQEGDANSIYELTVTWNAGANISASLVIKHSDESAWDNCATSTANDSTYTSGKFGFTQNQANEVDKISFTSGGGGNQAPTVNAGNDQTIVQPNAATLVGTANDDGQPNPPAALTYTWSKTSGPGTVTFGDVDALSTTATFDTVGTYVLSLEADDGELSANDTVTITVNSASTGDFVEDFTTSSVIGSGTAGNYVPGTNWSLAHGSAQIDTSMTLAGGTGACRLGYGGTPRVGPDNGSPHTLITNTAYGKGTYTCRAEYRIVMVFGYQDANNYYVVDTHTLDYTSIDQANLAVGKVVNGVTTWLGCANFSTIGDGASGDIYNVSVDWDPANHQIKATLTCVTSSNTYRDSCSTPVLSDILSGSDPVWTTGKFGSRVTQLTNIDKLGFTNAAANLDDHFTASAIGSGTGGGYTAGTNWSVAHGMVKQTTSGTFGTGSGIIELGQAGGVGPNNGTPNSLLSVNNCSGGLYTFRGATNTDFVFGYADDSNYYFAEVKSMSRTVGGTAATRSFAIGKVAGGTTTWLGHVGTFDTTDANVIYETEITWNNTANTISGVVRRYTYSGSTETLTNIHAITAFADGNLRESGKFGAREATSTVRKIDRMAYSGMFCSNPTDGIFDAYGGHKGIKGTKTGFFHLQQIGSRWMWITPEGNGFMAMGISIMGRQTGAYGHDRDQDLNLKAHIDYCNIKHSNSFGAWQTATVDRMRAWGLNYTGYYTFEDLRAKGIPAVKTLGLLTGALNGTTPSAGNIWYDLGFDYQTPDAYATNIQTFANARIRSEDPDAKDPTILGLYADEPDNMKGMMYGHQHLGLALLLGKTQIGTAASSNGYTGTLFTNCAKQAFINYLIGKYTTIGALNTAWGMSYASWNDLNSLTYSSGTYGSWTNPTRSGYSAYRTDLDHGLEMFAQQWATVVKNARDGWDTNHAIGQQIYAAPILTPVATGFSNVGAFDFFMAEGDANDFTALGGKPFMRVFYSSAEPDSPLKFDGTVDGYSKVNVSGTDFLKVHVNGADFWYGNSGARDFSTSMYGHINGMTLSGKSNPGGMRMRWCGNESGGGWFECQPTDPPNTGTVDQWITALNAMAPTKATYDRFAFYNNMPVATQEDRGEAWSTFIDSVVNDQTSGGVKFRVGGEIWSWVDTGWDYTLEARNFGLVTVKDNAYDSVEATTLGADGTAGTWDDQSADYGDFITAIQNANLGIYDRILGL